MKLLLDVFLSPATISQSVMQKIYAFFKRRLPRVPYGIVRTFFSLLFLSLLFLSFLPSLPAENYLSLFLFLAVIVVLHVVLVFFDREGGFYAPMDFDLFSWRFTRACLFWAYCGLVGMFLADLFFPDGAPMTGDEAFSTGLVIATAFLMMFYFAPGKSECESFS